jgi:hypothetical protein
VWNCESVKCSDDVLENGVVCDLKKHLLRTMMTGYSYPHFVRALWTQPDKRTLQVSVVTICYPPFKGLNKFCDEGIILKWILNRMWTRARWLKR